MKRIQTKTGILSGILFLLLGCDDIFEKNLSGKQVNLLVPGDSVVTTVSKQLFLWEALPGATAYRLVIVTPDFSRPGACLLDTVVENLRYEYNLSEGVYAWGIRAENSAWTSEFSNRLLIISSSSEEP